VREASETSPSDTLRITLAHSDQSRHLLDALRGHCEAELAWTSDAAPAVVVTGEGAGSRGVLRRVNAWLGEFGVDSVTLELNGRTYDMRKS
jgi:hypothetical protein